MITRAQQRAPDPDFLSQGDVISGCWLRSPAAELTFLKKCRKLFDGRPDLMSLREPPTESTTQLVLAEAQLTDLILLEYSCNVDKILERIAAGEPPNPSELCFAAPIRPISNFRRIAADIRAERVENVAYIEPVNGRTELVVDFTFAATTRMRDLLKKVPSDRLFGLTNEGQSELMYRWARHFGSKDRVQIEAARAPDPGLLARAIAAVSAPPASAAP